MARADFHKTNHLFLAYPKKFYNEYDGLAPFFDKLIELIPNDVHLFIIATSKSVSDELKAKFSHKDLDVIVAKNWDEIWLRDCMGVVKGADIIKPIYFPNYCTLKNYWNYFKEVNKQSKQVIQECLSNTIIDMPLIMDGGNFVTNSSLAFLTDKIIEDNPGKYVPEMLADYLGINPIIISRNYYDVIGHTDGYMAFRDEANIFISNYPKFKYLKNDNQYTSHLKEVAEGYGLNVLRVNDRPVNDPATCDCKRDDSLSCYYSAKGTYINYMTINGYAIMPEYSFKLQGIDYNQQNRDILTNSGLKVLSINCDELAKFGGSLHCLSWQV